MFWLLPNNGCNRYNNNGYFNDNEKAQAAINVTIFHWGVKAWAVFAITDVIMGVLAYREGLPLDLPHYSGTTLWQGDLGLVSGPCGQSGDGDFRGWYLYLNATHRLLSGCCGIV
jgi:hypothetical protein